MDAADQYLDLNREAWNRKTDVHVRSDFYDVQGFLAGQSTLNGIELALLGDVNGKSVLHLQCHFGLDTLSLARMGAEVCGVDLSDNAIAKARELNAQLGLSAEFVCCDVYTLPEHLNRQFDIVYTSYGTIGWLPDIQRWASVVSHFMKPGGRLVFAEFHPVVWMFDDKFEQVAYRYFHSEPIVETGSGSYADRDAPITHTTVSWNHGLAEVISALIASGLRIRQFTEYDYSPYNCFAGTVEFAPGKFRIAHLGDKIPMVYSLLAGKEQ